MTLIDVIALKGTAKILLALRKQDQNYSALAKLVGFSTTTSRALKAMESNKLVTKQVLNEPYRPVIYSLTERGRKLSSILDEIERL
jgi:DNA-binding HxlR family transcriptional regulator